MTEYAYQVYFYYKMFSEPKGVNKYKDCITYPEAMDCYKDFQKEISALLMEGNVENWFTTLVRTHIKGSTRWNVNVKHEGTI